ncbi:glycosyltransferase [Blastococcus saxobsidens]|uniref:Putative galactosyltransferase n=1 Tax=Blastococcus saxobsidens (strain DD2) TaxID=1146883 RepID=H6RMX3_BLASD|nr:glycosyltransferase [Blastococcus saxobsidens]CCG01326.1 putative galactosyltransferase [Blastococcus saxobsidens DD2]
MPELPVLRGPGGRPLRVAHLTTVDMSLALLLGRELQADVETGLETFALSAPGPFASDVEKTGATHVPVPGLTRSWQPRQDLRAARELVSVLKGLRLDVLHTHNPKTGVIGRLAGRAAGVPVIVNTCHGLWAGPGDPWRRQAMVLGAEALAAQASHAELYQNAADRHRLRRFVSPRRSRVVGNGIDLERFRPDPAGQERVRAELGIGSAELVVGAIGRRVQEKGIAEFVAAARALGERARFLWIGPEDPDKPDALAEEDPAVRWVPARSDMPGVYSALDVFVLPSYREGFSRSGMEAAACGLPMVLSDIRGCREVGDHERHLLLVPPRDADALTGAIARLLDDAALRARLGAAAGERARAEFDQVGIAAESLRTYAAVARRRGLGWAEQ